MDIEPQIETETENEHGALRAARWDLVRDVAVLQVKLIVDGLRDLILLPASLIAGIVSLVKHEDGYPGPAFYQLLHFGKMSERRINLFGAYSSRNSREDDEELGGEVDIDDLVSRVESYVVDEYRRGDITTQAKAKIDQALDAIQRAGRNKDQA
jgi:hypothetical protein